MLSECINLVQMPLYNISNYCKQEGNFVDVYNTNILSVHVCGIFYLVNKR